MDFDKLLDEMENGPGFFKHNNFHIEKIDKL